MEEFCGVVINGRWLVVNKMGEVYGLKANGEMKIIENVSNDNTGYNRIRCGNKMTKRHRIIAYIYLGLDLENPKQQIDHIDGNKLNNSLDNLRIVTHQQNQWNRTKAKGYYFDKQAKKWRAEIRLNNKKIHLGYYNTESEARVSYLTAKLIYHKII
jgi:hypothetical protein